MTNKLYTDNNLCETECKSEKIGLHLLVRKVGYSKVKLWMLQKLEAETGTV